MGRYERSTDCILTADCRTGLEDLRYLWVHVDQHVLLGFDLVVALLHLGLDPLGERRTHDREDYIRDVLARQLLELFLNREIALNTRV